jgi:microcystin degradation protein MlrC
MPLSVMAGIRAALVVRGSSLRQWAHAWARAQGEPADQAYHTLRMAIQRRLNRRQPPMGPVALRLIRALRADLGAGLVPDFGERGERND